MDTINDQAKEDAWKALFIITIISALSVKFALLYRIVKTAGGLGAVTTGPRGVRLQTNVPLIIGDISVALFSLVERARVTFEKRISSPVKCRSQMLSQVYFMYSIPFACIV